MTHHKTTINKHCDIPIINLKSKIKLYVFEYLFMEFLFLYVLKFLYISLSKFFHHLISSFWKFWIKFKARIFTFKRLIFNIMNILRKCYSFGWLLFFFLFSNLVKSNTCYQIFSLKQRKSFLFTLFISWVHGKKFLRIIFKLINLRFFILFFWIFWNIIAMLNVVLFSVQPLIYA